MVALFLHVHCMFVTCSSLLYCFSSSGLPPGVCNIVFGVGPRAGEAIVAHPDVAVVSFTGSIVVGERIQSMSAPFCRMLSLEVSGSLSFEHSTECLVAKIPIMDLVYSSL